MAMRSRLGRCGIAALAAAALAAVPAAAAPARSARGGTLTVMTRNVFLGADLSPFVGTRSPDELLLTAGAVWSQIQSNDFAHRARALAAEIAATKPDLVGLQEVSLYRSDRPADGPITPAETVEQDYLRMLLRALEARGRHYRAAATFESGDLEIPVGLPPTMDIRATDRDAILVRAGAARRGIRVREVVAGAYNAATSVPFAGTALRTTRGWIAMTLAVRGARIVVFDTHLDSVDAQVRAAQGQELLARIAAKRAPVVLLGDLNSGPGVDTTVYDALRAGGLDDAWTQVHGAAPGLTCCFAPDLRSTARPLSSRIDLVLHGNGVRATRAEVVGEARRDRVHGLWPSDHAGLVAKLRLP
jgi:endonuclease/exonuclease/phosphatase family metal-dependent hydrolase